MAAIPTPRVPDLHWYPLKQPTIPMAKPKKKVLMVAGSKSLNSILSKTRLKYCKKKHHLSDFHQIRPENCDEITVKNQNW